MRMPVMDGWEFSRRLREMLDEVPVVIMTAAANAAGWAAEINARGKVAKPFDLDELSRVVEKTLATA